MCDIVKVFKTSLTFHSINLITVNRIHGWETRWKNNITHYLCYCPGLCRNVVLPHHVCIVFLLKQQIAMSWCSQPTITFTIG